MQLAVDVERDEDEGGTFGEPFIDYVRVYVLINLMRKRRAILDFLDPFLLHFYFCIEKFTYAYSISRGLPSSLLVFLILTP